VCFQKRAVKGGFIRGGETHLLERESLRGPFATTIKQLGGGWGEETRSNARIDDVVLRMYGSRGDELK